MRITGILFILCFMATVALTGCTGKEKKPGVPENAIDPDVMKNPATASSDKNTSAALPSFQFDEETHDFGKVMQGEKVVYAFKFKNSGKGDLVISNASGSCGCTVPEWPKGPVHAGDDGVIKITFSSEGKVGHQNVRVTLVANTIPNNKVLTLTGFVDTPEEK